MKILYVDGGCSGNSQEDLTQRAMRAVVTDENGAMLVDKYKEGGSNNIAELWAVLEALQWAEKEGIEKVQIITDSRNNISWATKFKFGKGVNDPRQTQQLMDSIFKLRDKVKYEMVWVGRDHNLAGQYIESIYGL